MKTAFLFVLLTLDPSGGTTVSFVNLDTRPACEARASAVIEVLESANVTVVDSRCAASPLRFTRFSHEPEPGAPHYTYLVHLAGEDGDVRIETQANADDCRQAAARLADAGGATYCATSRQRLEN